MMILFTLSILTGAVLGMRLRVLILVPAISFLVFGIAGIGTIRGDAFTSIVSTMLLAAICIQMGYIGGSLSRFAMAATRLPSRREATTQRQHDRQPVRVEF